MAKSRGGGGQRRRGGPGGRGAKSSSTNPFEQVANRKQKFEVLNKRTKGQLRNVGRARELALEKRKKTLLVEYQANKKANTFKDRRFGEGDPSLSLEERMLMRFQKERQRKARRSSAGLFNLDQPDFQDDDDEDGGGLLLTHKGRAIGEDDFFGGGGEAGFGSSDEEDERGQLGSDIVKELHFGGGLLKRKRGDDDGADGSGGRGKKSRADLLEEIMAKSKMHRAAKARAKDAQEEATDRLDAGLKDLLGELQFRAKGDRGGGKASEDDVEYEKMFLEVRDEERKAKAGDRTKSEEELAREERERLEALEKARIARMRGENREEEEELEEDEKGAEDDEEEDDESSEDEDDEEEEGDEEGEGDEEDGDEKGEEGDDESDDDEDEDEKLEVPPSKKPEVEQVPVRTKRLRQEKAVSTALSSSLSLGVNPDMPYVLEVPRSMEQLEEMLEQHCRSPIDVREMLLRIVKYHTPKAGGAQAGGSREKVHNLYDLLLRRLLAGQGGPETDGLAEVLMAMTPDMGPVAANLWGRLLVSLHGRVEKALRDYALGGSESCWPSAGALALLRLLPLLFPASDQRHPVVTPALLLLGQCLSECPVTSGEDLTAGLTCATLMLLYTDDEAKRLVPEATAFLTSTLAALAPLRKQQDDEEQQAGALLLPPLLPTFQPLFVKRLRMALKKWKGATDQLAPLRLGQGGTAGLKADDEAMVQLSAGALRAACKVVERAAQSHYKDNEAAPEALAGLSRQLAWHAARAGSGPVKELVEGARQAVEGAVSGALAKRRALEWRAAVKQVVKSLEPRMVEDYVVKKDAGMDREKAKLKQLQRQVKREKKGAMRELRRDAAFLDAEVTKQKLEKEEQRRKAVAANTAWLQEQQATINQQVRMSRGKDLRGGGSGAAKSKAGGGRR